MMNNMNNRFKTAICKHFEQNGTCHMGTKCHFAHGKEELRVMNENMPIIHQNQMTMNTQSKPSWSGDFPTQQTQLGVTNQSGGHYKTAKCKFFEKGHCKFGQNCSFAHGEMDLRSTNSYNSPQGTGGLSHSNAGGHGSSIQNEVARQQIQQLGQSLEAFHANNLGLLDQIKKGQEMAQTGNVQGAASVFHSVMSRPDKTKEDKESYAMFTYKMQQFGDNLYQQLQSQQFSQPIGSPQLGNLDMNQMGSHNSGSGFNPSGGYKQNYGQHQQHQHQQNYQKDQQQEGGYHGKEMNQGGHMGSTTFGGNMAGNYAMQNAGYGSHYGGNQGGFGGAQKENSYSRF